MTEKETNLVSRLRIKMGDNPSYEGRPIIASQVWEDSEYLSQLHSSLITLFKGKKVSLEILTDFEEECLILHSRIELVDILSIDSTRYAKYTLREAGVSRVSPQEFIALSKSLSSRLKDMLEEGGDEASDMNPKVKEGVIRRYDRFRGEYTPSKFDEIPSNLPFSLSSGVDGITINISKIIIPDYHTHYLYKKISGADGYGSIIKEYYQLQSSQIIDDDVVDGTTYVYTLFVEDVNNNSNFHQKSITHSTT